MRVKRFGLMLIGAAALALTPPQAISPLSAAEPVAVAVDLSSSTLAGVERLDCMDCSGMWFSCGSSQGVQYFCIYHMLGSVCGSWNQEGEQHDAALASAPSQKAPTTASFAAVGGEESEGGCVRCGGTSQCHTEYQEGPCHVSCGGNASSPLRRLDRITQTVDASTLREVFRPGSLVSYNATRQSIQVHSDCAPELIASNIPIDRTLARRIELAFESE